MIRFSVHKRCGVSYYDQIKSQLVLHVLYSTAREGEKLPPVRGAARLLHLHQNTVFSIYKRLQKEQLVESRKGRGTFVRTSGREQVQRQEELLQFVASVTQEAEARFHLAPREFATLLYRSTSKVGHRSQIFLVVNEDEARTVDSAILSGHFNAQFVPLHIEDILRPSQAILSLMRRCAAFITITYLMPQVQVAAVAIGKEVIELRRDPEFVTDLAHAAATRKVGVIFQHRSTRNHYRDVVFKNLYPEVFKNVSFLALHDTQRVLNLLRREGQIFCSPLCLDALRKMARPQKEIRLLRGWISQESLNKIRALLLLNRRSNSPAAPPH